MELQMKAAEPSARPLIEGIIKDFVAGSGENSLKNEANEKAWDEPLVGFCRGDDPIFQFFKTDIGQFFWTPLEAFSLLFPDSGARPGDLAVVSWVLPHIERTRLDNRRTKDLPAERWVRARNFGEAFNVLLARHVAGELGARGIQAVVPAQLPQWAWRESDKYVFASNWSERHAAYAAGLGTFSLCDGLITPKGKAMRCGSVVARVEVAPAKRPYDNHHAYCLFYTTGKCRKCIARCPVGAISESGHDKVKCRAFLSDVVSPYSRATWGIDSYGCGLCQTGVPCESRIPEIKPVSPGSKG
jgi:epoxyqueuosine reductase